MIDLSPGLTGLVIEIVGALLLAKGVIMSDHQILALSTGGYGGISPKAEREYISNAYDAKFGTAFLIAGFILQSDAAAGRHDTILSLISISASIGALILMQLFRSSCIARRADRLKEIHEERKGKA